MSDKINHSDGDLYGVFKTHTAGTSINPEDLLAVAKLRTNINPIYNDLENNLYGVLAMPKHIWKLGLLKHGVLLDIDNEASVFNLEKHLSLFIKMASECFEELKIDTPDAVDILLYSVLSTSGLRMFLSVADDALLSTYSPLTVRLHKNFFFKDGVELPKHAIKEHLYTLIQKAKE